MVQTSWPGGSFFLMRRLPVDFDPALLQRHWRIILVVLLE